MARTMLLYIGGRFLVAVSAEIRRNLSVFVSDYRWNMGVVALETVRIGHAVGMRAVAFQALEKGSVLLVAEGAVLLGMRIRGCAHGSVLFFMARHTNGFRLFQPF